MLDLENKSKDTQALYLFSIGKTPLEVKFELDIPTSDVYDLQEEFWALDQLHELSIRLQRDKELSAIIYEVISFLERIWNAQ